jgi:carboxylesterase
VWAGVSGEKSKARTVFIWFILPWIIFATAIGYIYMTSKNDAAVKLEPYINLKSVDTHELLILDKKRAITEGVKNENNMPSYLPGSSDVGVLLIHGFTASPAEMNDLAEYLNKELGYSVYNARIVGHGSYAANLNITTYKDWYDSLKWGYSVLSKNAEKIYIVGQSMGALLAMNIAMENKVDGVVLLGPALFVKDPMFPLVSVAKFFIKEIKKDNFNKDLKDIYYDVKPIKAAYQLSKLIEYTKNNINKLQVPTLVIQSEYDDTINPKLVIDYFNSLDLKNKSVVVLKDNEKTKHVLTNMLNPDKEKVFKIISDWLEAN